MKAVEIKGINVVFARDDDEGYVLPPLDLRKDGKRKKHTKKFWTDSENELLTEKYPNCSMGELTELFGRSAHSIYCQAFILGLKKDKEFVSTTKRRIISNPNHGSRKFLYQKGQVSHNKGKRQADYMSPESIEKTLKTRFKKGNIPHNHRPIGSERILKSDGYVQVKIADPNTWELKHRLVWKQHNGAIPEGANIQFRDDNRKNCEIDNLYMITRENQIIENSGAVKMTDGMVAMWLSGKRGKNKEEIATFKEDKPLLELKRNQLKLSRTIKKVENEKD